MPFLRSQTGEKLSVKQAKQEQMGREILGKAKILAAAMYRQRRKR